MDTATIAEFKIFEGLDRETLEKIASCAKEQSFPAEARLMAEDTPAEEFYLIQSGKVNVLAEQWCNVEPGEGTEWKPVQTLGPGDVLGWSWLIEPYVWGFNADAVEDTDVIAIDGALLREYAKSNPNVELQLLKRFVGVMKERLVATRMHLALYAGQPFAKCEGG